MEMSDLADRRDRIEDSLKPRAAVFRQPLERVRLLQGGAYIEDAVFDRLTYHKCDEQFLKIYRIHGSRIVQWLISCIILGLHFLSFFENPSSLCLTTDVRLRDVDRIVVPYPIILSIEGFFLLLLTLDCSIKVYGYGIQHIRSYGWNMLYIVSLAVCFVGWITTLCFQSVTCDICKIRCFFRPLIILQHSSLLKKAFLCMVKAIPSIFSVFLLFVVHNVFFALVGLVIMPYDKGPAQSKVEFNFQLHFGGEALDAMLNMFILLTTANNPDLMTRAYNQNRFYAIFFVIYVAVGVHLLLQILFAVIFQKFREHFRESMRHTILRRKAALVAAFQVLSDHHCNGQEREIPFSRLQTVLKELSLPPVIRKCVSQRMIEVQRQRSPITYNVFSHDIFVDITYRRKSEHQRKMDSLYDNFDPLKDHRKAVKNAQATLAMYNATGEKGLHSYLPYLKIIFSHPLFVHFGSMVTILNVFFIMATENPKLIEIFIEKETFFFLAFYIFEQLITMWALTPRVYISIALHKLDLFTVIPTLICSLLFVVVFQGMEGIPLEEERTAVLVLGGSIHILIGVRMMRVVLSMKLPKLIAITMRDLLVNLLPFLQLMAVMYYVFAILGVMLFSGKIFYSSKYDNCWRFEDVDVVNNSCPYGAGYHQREYWGQNFDDFGAAIMTLWNLMMVNNWDIIVEAYTKATGSWSLAYFISWYVVSVAVGLSLLTAVTVENFLTRWSIFAKHERSRRNYYQSQKVARENMEAQQLADNIASGITTPEEAITFWQKAKRLKRDRKRAMWRAQNRTRDAPDDVPSRGSRISGRQSQPLSLVQVLDVKMPSMEEIRQHLALSPYAPTAFAIDIASFKSCYDPEDAF